VAYLNDQFYRAITVSNFSNMFTTPFIVIVLLISLYVESNITLVLAVLYDKCIYVILDHVPYKILKLLLSSNCYCSPDTGFILLILLLFQLIKIVFVLKVQSSYKVHNK